MGKLALVAGLLLTLSAAALRNPQDVYDEGAAPADWAPPPSGTGDEAAAPVEPSLLLHRTQRMQVLDAEARIFLYKGFLTPEECDHIVAKAEPRLERSGVVATDKHGETEISEIRTSFGVFLEREEDEVVKAIEDRIAAWTLLPAGNGEGLQVLRYNNGQKYDAHWDYFFDEEHVQNGGNRYATVLSYLTDVEEGGETVFPNIPAPGGENPGFSECARHHLAVRPRKGDAVLFHSIAPTGALEKRSLHTACPVIKGTKYSMAKWIHVGHYAVGAEQPVAVGQHVQQVPKRAPRPGECADLNEFCDTWAGTGECERNAAYMIGTSAYPGSCLKACGRCDVLPGSGAKATVAAAGGATSTV